MSRTKHPGYVIGDHWLEAAYARVCAGEDIREVMADYGWVPVEAVPLAVEAERERIDDEWHLRMQGVLEHGVKSLNRRAAAEFAEQYPDLWTFSDAIRARGEA